MEGDSLLVHFPAGLQFSLQLGLGVMGGTQVFGHQLLPPGAACVCTAELLRVLRSSFHVVSGLLSTSV